MRVENTPIAEAEVFLYNCSSSQNYPELPSRLGWNFCGSHRTTEEAVYCWIEERNEDETYYAEAGLWLSLKQLEELVEMLQGQIHRIKVTGTT